MLEPVVAYFDSIVVTRLENEPEAELYDWLTTANEAEAVVRTDDVLSLLVTRPEKELESTLYEEVKTKLVESRLSNLSLFWL
jgi:hypothetical protein